MHDNHQPNGHIRAWQYNRTTSTIPGVMVSNASGAQVDKSYSQPEECLLGGDGDLGGAYIVRLPCGDSNDYLR